jgi:hypothetical protein
LADADPDQIRKRGESAAEGAFGKLREYFADRGVVGGGEHLQAQRCEVRDAAVTDSKMVGGGQNNPARGVMFGLAVALMAGNADVEIAFAVAAARKGEDHYRRRSQLPRIGQKYGSGDMQRTGKRHAGGYVNLELDRFHISRKSTGHN